METLVGRLERLITEAVDLRCPNCGSSLGKDTEQPRDARCDACGTRIKNPRGYNDADEQRIVDNEDEFRSVSMGEFKDGMERWLKDLTNESHVWIDRLERLKEFSNVVKPGLNVDGLKKAVDGLRSSMDFVHGKITNTDRRERVVIAEYVYFPLYKRTDYVGSVIPPLIACLLVRKSLTEPSAVESINEIEIVFKRRLKDFWMSKFHFKLISKAMGEALAYSKQVNKAIAEMHVALRDHVGGKI